VLYPDAGTRSCSRTGLASLPRSIRSWPQTQACGGRGSTALSPIRACSWSG
jgi:hypothetical protein